MKDPDKAQGVIEAHSLSRFAAVGALATAIDFGVFAAFVTLAGAPAAAANVASFATSVIVNFNLNRRWSFRQKKDAAVALRQGARFLFAYGGGLLLSTAIVAGLATTMPGVLAKAISIPIVFLYNYGCARLWVFREAGVTEPSVAAHDGARSRGR